MSVTRAERATSPSPRPSEAPLTLSVPPLPRSPPTAHYRCPRHESLLPCSQRRIRRTHSCFAPGPRQPRGPGRKLLTFPARTTSSTRSAATTLTTSPTTFRSLALPRSRGTRAKIIFDGSSSCRKWPSSIGSMTIRRPDGFRPCRGRGGRRCRRTASDAYMTASLTTSPGRRRHPEELKQPSFSRPSTSFPRQFIHSGPRLGAADRHRVVLPVFHDRLDTTTILRISLALKPWSLRGCFCVTLAFDIRSTKNINEKIFQHAGIGLSLRFGFAVSPQCATGGAREHSCPRGGWDASDAGPAVEDGVVLLHERNVPAGS